MAQLTAGFETGSNGATIATTDPGNANAFDNVFIGAGSAVTYDNAHVRGGTLAAKVDSPSGGAADFKWTGGSVGTVTDHYGRLYVYFTAAPAVFQDFLKVESGGVVCCYMSLVGAAKIAVADSAGANIFTTTNAISLNQWVRIEYHVIHSTTVGQVEVKFFNTPEDTTPTETQTSAANKNLLASADQLVYGARAAQSNGSYWIDDIVGNATSYPGPVAVVSPAALPVWPRVRFNG